MSKRDRRAIEADDELRVRRQDDHAAGVKAVAISMKRALAEMGPRADGPDPAAGSTRPRVSTARAAPGPIPRSVTGTRPSSARTAPRRSPRRRPGPGPRRSSSPGTASPSSTRQSEHWLGQQGRITHPMIKRPGAEPLRSRSPGTTPSSMIADRAERPGQPGRGDLLHLRPDVQRGGVRVPAVRPGVRHQQPARLLQHVPRVDQSVALAEIDRHRQGQRQPRGRARGDADRPGRSEPGHQPPADAVGAGDAKERGAKIISINPLREAGLVNFRNPQEPRGIVGKGTALADLHLPIKINGDLALFQAIGSLLVQWDALDHDFIDRYTTGSRSGAITSAASTGTRSTEPPGCPGSRSPRRPQMLARLRRRPSSAGRWG